MLAALVETLQFYFLTQTRPFKPRQRMPGGYKKDQAVSEAGWKRHTEALKAAAPAVHAALQAWARDLNVLLARGVERVFAVTRDEHRRTLAEHDVVDFPELLERAVELLQQMDEFSQSRYRLESRYHHVLVDEFQDTSRLQWRLVDLLVRSWGEGFGLVHEAPVLPSLFIVGDRKQSIYRFRDADVTLLDQAASTIRGLRPDGGGRRAISRSFRARPALLAFVNDVCAEIAATGAVRPDAFRYDDSDHFPLDAGPLRAPAKNRETSREPIRGRAAAGPHRRRGQRGDGARRGGGDRPPDRHDHRARSRHRRARVRPRPATSRSCSGRATPTASSSGRWRRGASRPTSTRDWVSSTPTRSRISSR